MFVTCSSVFNCDTGAAVSLWIDTQWVIGGTSLLNLEKSPPELEIAQKKSQLSHREWLKPFNGLY